MRYSRPWMFLGLAQIALAAAMFCQQSRESSAEKPMHGDATAPLRKPAGDGCRQLGHPTSPEASSDSMSRLDVRTLGG